MKMICRILLMLIAVVAIAYPEVTEPKPGTPERKAIMEAMRPAVTKEIGVPVKFTGTVKVSGEWARFDGNVAPADGKPLKGDAAFLLELDYFALLRKVKGEWAVAHGGFAGDISVTEDAKRKFPKAPKELLPDSNQ